MPEVDTEGTRVKNLGVESGEENKMENVPEVTWAKYRRGQGPRVGFRDVPVWTSHIRLKGSVGRHCKKQYMGTWSWGTDQSRDSSPAPGRAPTDQPVSSLTQNSLRSPALGSNTMASSVIRLYEYFTASFSI